MATLLRILESLDLLWEYVDSLLEYVNNAFWNITMARCDNDKAFIEEEDCDWP